jgi:hypothetical protein
MVVFWQPNYGSRPRQCKAGFLPKRDQDWSAAFPISALRPSLLGRDLERPRHRKFETLSEDFPTFPPSPCSCQNVARKIRTLTRRRPSPLRRLAGRLGFAAGAARCARPWPFRLGERLAVVPPFANQPTPCQVRPVEIVATKAPAGYSRLMSLDDEGTLAILKAHRKKAD